MISRFARIWAQILVVILPIDVMADEIYKCVDENGKTRFSEHPCGQNAEKVELKSSGSDINFSGGDNWDNIKYSNKEREVNRELVKHEAALAQLQKEQAEKVADLRYRQSFAAKTIVGKRYTKRLENEIKQVDKEYNNKIRDERTAIKNLKKELENGWQ